MNNPGFFRRGYIVKYNFDGIIQWISLLETNLFWRTRSNTIDKLYLFKNIISDNQGHLYIASYGTRIDKFYNTNGTEFTNPLTSSSDEESIGYLAKFSFSRVPTLSFFNIVIRSIN